jgi:ribonuclease G
LVQVTGYAEEGKAIPVTQKVLFKSRYAIVTPDAPGLNISRSIRDDDMRDELMVIAKEVMDGREMGLIIRSCCAEASPEDIADDVEEMAQLADNVINDDSDEMAMLVAGDGPHVLAWRDWTEVVLKTTVFWMHWKRQKAPLKALAHLVACISSPHAP